MKIDKNYISALMRAGFINVRKHPRENLFIICYTEKLKRHNLWNDITVYCRGTIIDERGNILAQPFPKIPMIAIENLNISNYISFEKLDGSLGILYWVAHTPFIATKSSFDSYQCLIANRILHVKYNDIFHLFDKTKTYLFEIISSFNKIIVDYNTSDDLYLIGVVDTATKRELNIEDYRHLKFPLPEKQTVSSREITDTTNFEGYVLSKCNHTFAKIKLKWYVESFILYKKDKDLITKSINTRDVESLENRITFKWLFHYAKDLNTFITNILLISHKMQENQRLSFLNDYLPTGISNEINSVLMKSQDELEQQILSIFKKLFLSAQYYSINRNLKNIDIPI